MATAVTQSIQIHDITQCSICLETFTEPKMLPCIHTFCLTCLDELCRDTNPGQEAACPLCRKVFTIPPGGVEDIQNNIFMNQLLQVNQSGSAAEDASIKPELCELCLESAAELFFCAECDQCICDRCCAVHKKLKATQSHKVVDIDDISTLGDRKKVVVNYCEEHPDKQVELFCFDCNALLCVTCYGEHNNKHECSVITKAAEKFNQQLVEDIKNVSVCALQSHNSIKEIEASKKKLLAKVEATEVELSNVMEELNSFKTQALKDLECKKDEMELQIAIAESFTRYCQELKEKGTVCDISRSANDIHIRAEELVAEVEQNDTKLRQADLQFTSSFAEQACKDNFISALFPYDAETTSINECNSESRQAGHLTSPHNSSFERAESVEWNASSFLDQPKLLHTISGVGSIFGITTLGNELFVIQGQKWRGVDVYDSETFTHKRYLPIPESNKLETILACRGCLYMNFIGEKQLLRYEYAEDTCTYIQLNGICSGLSKACYDNILVTLSDINEIEERDPTTWNLIKQTRLDSNIVPKHGIKFSDQYFLLIHNGESKDVVKQRNWTSSKKKIYIVDSIRRITKSYSAGFDFQPWHMVIDNKGNFLVTDSSDSNITLLNQLLTLIGQIKIPGYNCHRALVLHLDEVNRRLYIGESSEGGRLFVLEAKDNANNKDED